jgi:hypothetical protein
VRWLLIGAVLLSGGGAVLVLTAGAAQIIFPVSGGGLELCCPLRK